MQDMPNGVVSPFLRWAGSKRQLIPALRAYAACGFTRYVEPFLGSGALFFALQPERALLGDVNRDVIDCFTGVRDDPSAVHQALLRCGTGESAYYEIRGRDPETLDVPQRAARMIYLMRFGFNGIYRTNQRGQFNVPYAPRKTGRLPTREELGNAAAVLGGAQLERADFETVLDSCRRRDFVYVDPPYAGASHRSACQFGPGSFTVADIPRLIAALHRVDRRGVKFVLSYASVQGLPGSVSGWHCNEVRVRRVVAGSVKARGEVREILVTNCAADAEGRTDS